MQKCIDVLYMLCTVCVFHTISVWYISYVYGTYHTHMVCFFVPYVYGTVRVYVSPSMKLSIRTEDYILKAYFSKAAPKGCVCYSQRFIISYILTGL